MTQVACKAGGVLVCQRMLHAYFSANSRVTNTCANARKPSFPGRLFAMRRVSGVESRALPAFGTRKKHPFPDQICARPQQCSESSVALFGIPERGGDGHTQTQRGLKGQKPASGLRYSSNRVVVQRGLKRKGKGKGRGVREVECLPELAAVVVAHAARVCSSGCWVVLRVVDAAARKLQP